MLEVRKSRNRRSPVTNRISTEAQKLHKQQVELVELEKLPAKFQQIPNLATLH